MTVGGDIGVMAHAKSFLAARDASLSAHLAKNMGFGLGLEFRDSGMVLNEKNAHQFQENMVFTLAWASTQYPHGGGQEGRRLLHPEARDLLDAARGPVLIQKDGAPEVLTKFTRSTARCPTTSPAGTRRMRRRRRRRTKRTRACVAPPLQGREGCTGKCSQYAAAEAAGANEEEDRGGAEEAGEDGGGDEEEEEEEEVNDLQAYKSPADYPRDVQQNQIRVDLDNECLISPSTGSPCPST